jgi:hypothetical protein
LLARTRQITPERPEFLSLKSFIPALPKLYFEISKCKAAYRVRKWKVKKEWKGPSGSKGWLAANFWRAVADRFSHTAAGQALRLGSIELWFAGSWLLVTLIGLVWSLALTSRHQSH